MASKKQWAAVFGISALLGLGLGGIAYSTQPAPELQQVAVAEHAPPITVGDPNGLLTPQQERMLIDATGNLRIASPSPMFSTWCSRKITKNRSMTSRSGCGTMPLTSSAIRRVRTAGQLTAW